MKGKQMPIIVRTKDSNEELADAINKFIEEKGEEELLRYILDSDSPMPNVSKSEPDITSWGDKDIFKLISKTSSDDEKCMKSTKAMKVGRGVVLQMTTKQENPDGSYALAEALTYVPETFIKEISGSGSEIINRQLCGRI